MSVKRTPRPLRPDLVEAKGDGPEELAALAEVIEANTPRAKIERIAKVLPDKAKELRSRLKADGSADNALLDEIAIVEREACQADLFKAIVKEHNRRLNLPTAEDQYQRWRELADEIRQERPYLNSKAEIARLVERRLSNSHDPRDRQFKKPADTIRRKI